MVSSSSTSDNEKEKAFPKIMKCNGYTVLFSKRKRGTVIHKDKVTFGKQYTVSDFAIDWPMEHFKDTDDVITLCSSEVGHG